MFFSVLLLLLLLVSSGIEVLGQATGSATSGTFGTSAAFLAYNVTTLAGSGFGSANLQGTYAQFYQPRGLTSDQLGNIYVADSGNHKIRKITPVGQVSTYAGVGGVGTFADGSWTAAYFNFPRGLAFDIQGNLLVADTGNNRIRFIAASNQQVSTLAGSGSPAFADGQGAAASFNGPTDVAVDSSNNIFVADNYNNCIRKIATSKSVSTFAGKCSSTTVLQVTDGPATSATFKSPFGLDFSPNGELYVADYGSYKIRKISTSAFVSTVAGSSLSTTFDGPALSAGLSAVDISIDALGNVYFSDYSNNRIRMYSPLTNQVSTIAGNGDLSNRDALGTSASFYNPYGIALVNSKTLYVSDQSNQRVRAIEFINCTSNGYFDYPTQICSCYPGYGYDLAAKTCVICPSGTYKDKTSSASCSTCNSGSNKPPGATSCSANAPGTSCSPGFYLSTSGTCLACSAGQYQALSGQSMCNTCSAGQYQNLTGQISCLPCEVGTYQNTMGMPSCISCYPGSFQNMTGQTSCLPCEVGTFQNNPGRNSCTKCGVGRFQNTTGQALCLDCQPGEYQNLEGSKSCLKCPAGNFSEIAGSSLCKPCSDVSYQDQVGSIACKSCRLGFQPNTFKSGCVLQAQASFTLGPDCTNVGAENIKLYSSPSFVVSQCNNRLAVWDVSLASTAIPMLNLNAPTISTVAVSYSYLAISFVNQTAVRILKKQSNNFSLYNELNVANLLISITCLHIVDDKYLVIGGAEGNIYVWKLTDPDPVKIKSLPVAVFNQISLSCTGRNDILYVWSATPNYPVVRFNISSGESTNFNSFNSQGVRFVSFDNDHKTLVLKGLSDGLLVYDQSTPLSNIYQQTSIANFSRFAINSNRTMLGFNVGDQIINLSFYFPTSPFYQIGNSFGLDQPGQEIFFVEGSIYILGKDKVIRRYLLTDYMDDFPPAIVSTTPSFLGTLGTETITIKLDVNHRSISSLWAIDSVSIGGRSCLTANRLNASTITCVAPRNVGAFKTLQIKFNGLETKSSSLIGHRAPKILSITPDNSPTAGFTQITIFGENLGIAGPDIPVIAIKINGSYFNCTNVLQLNDTAIQCSTPSSAYPGPASIKIQVGDQYDENSSIFRYQNPEIYAVSPNSNLDLAGNEVIRIAGKNFGVCPGCTSAQISVTIDGRPCISLSRLNDTTITCRTPRYYGGNLPIIVNVEGFSSNSAHLLSYRRPEVARIEPSQSRVSTWLNITGSNFGYDNNTALISFTPLDVSLSTRFGDMVTWLDNTRIKCYYPRLGFEPNVTYTVSVSVGNQTSTQTNVTFWNLNANRLPIANSSFLEVDEMELLFIQVIVSDPNSDDVLSVFIEDFPSIGALYQYTNGKGEIITRANTRILDPTFRLYYQPEGVQNGYDSFTFYAYDEEYQSERATVNIYVKDVNQKPTQMLNREELVRDPDLWTNITLSAIGYDLDNTTFFYTITQTPINGYLRDAVNNINITSVPYDFGGIAVESVIVAFLPEPYTHGDNYADFIFTYSDRLNISEIVGVAPVTVNIDVAFKNHPPVIVNEGSANTVENSGMECDLNDIFFENDPDQSLTLFVTALPTKGTLYQANSAGAKTNVAISGLRTQITGPGILYYEPKLYENGADSFQIVANDGFLDSVPATFQITIDPVNQGPESASQFYVDFDGSKDFVEFELPVSDVDEDQQFDIRLLQGTERGKWSFPGQLSDNFDVSTANQGKNVIYELQSGKIRIRVDHDNKGGGFPYASIKLQIADSLGALSQNNLTINVFIKCPGKRVNNICKTEETSPTALCIDCMEGASCSETGERLPLNQDGYYPVEECFFLECTPLKACPGGQSKQQFTCENGYNATRCGQCNPGYYRLSEECKVCPDTEFLKQPALVAIIAIVALVFLLAMVNLIQKIDLGFMSILITYLQTISLFRSLKLTWPFLVNEMFRLMSAINFNIELASPECFIVQDNSKTYEYKFFATLGIPLALAFVVGMLIMFYSFLASIFSSFGEGAQSEIERWLNMRKTMKPITEKDKWKIDTMRSNELLYLEDGRNQSTPAAFISLYLMAVKMMYLSLSTKALELFDCSYDPKQRYFFEVEPNRSCFIDSWWWDLLPYSIGAIFLYVIGIPSLVAYMAILRIRYLKIRPAQRTWKQNFLLQVTYKAKKEYRPECDYWESVISVRKLVIVACQLFFSQYAEFQAVMMILIFQVALLFQSNTTPYSIRSLNVLESATLFSSTLVLTGGVLSQVSEFSDNQKEALGYVVVFIVVFSAILVMSMLMFHLREVYRLKNRKVNVEKPKEVDESAVASSSKPKELSVSKVKDFEIEKTSRTVTNTAGPSVNNGRRAQIVRAGRTSIRQTSTLDAGFE